MAFLDNSGDIILDAVLTDLGRQRLAAMNFNIAKFAIGDEEINYTLYNPNHPLGSIYNDLEIMQTPLLEAFTSDQSLMKSKLLSFQSTTLTHLPVLKINGKHPSHSSYSGDGVSSTGVGSTGFPGFLLLVDDKTYNVGEQTGVSLTGTGDVGVLHGTSGQTAQTTHIAIDQGIDGFMNIAEPMPAELLETQYIVRVDHRIIKLEGYVGVTISGNDIIPLSEQFIDDDGIATYYIVGGGTPGPVDPDTGLPTVLPSPVAGPYGSILGRRRQDVAGEAATSQDIENASTHEVFNLSLIHI